MILRAFATQYKRKMCRQKTYKENSLTIFASWDRPTAT
jgi:hypothetical protein